MATPRLSIFARWPEPGKAKTRLIPGLGAEGAARAYRKLLEHTVAEARKSGIPFELRTTGAPPERFREWLGGDTAIVEQVGGDLGIRMACVDTPAIIIGSDCPDCDANLMRRAADALKSNEAVIGPASDGGYYLIGLARPMPFLFDAMIWSTSGVFSETMRRFGKEEVVPAVLPELSDIDTPEDIARYPEFTR